MYKEEDRKTHTFVHICMCVCMYMFVKGKQIHTHYTLMKFTEDQFQTSQGCKLLDEVVGKNVCMAIIQVSHNNNSLVYDEPWFSPH